jgi:subtilase family serine protease
MEARPLRRAVPGDFILRSRPVPPRAVALQRRPIVNVDSLESRHLLTSTAGFTARPMFEVGPLVSTTTPPPGAFTPARIQQAYGFNQVTFGSVKGDGTGQTIAIVDAYDDPNIQNDLNVFDSQFGLPNIAVTRVNQSGGTSYPSADPTGGWETEEALDVEWAHAVAPGANILLVEAGSTSDTNLLAAANYASAHANVVSMSWGGSEFSGESSYDSTFNRPGVAFVASSGDSGAPISWPAASPNVLAVGGTALKVTAGGSWSGETGWSGSGGGPSAYASRPSYQAGVVTQTTRRANPDVATMPRRRRGSPSTIPTRRTAPATAGCRSAAPAPAPRSGPASWPSPTRAAP